MLADLAGLLADSPERAKAEFQRLKLAITLHVVGSKGRPFYRAEGCADLPWLAGTQDLSGAAVGRSLPVSAGSSRWGFTVDLPANNGTGSWKRA